MVALALPALVALWGFSVDDAWIVSRVVENGLETGGFSFNRGAARTDAVTALGFAEILAGICVLFRTSDAFLAARVLGAACTLLSLAVSAWTVAADAPQASARWLRPLLWFATAGLSPSLAAWAGAGLETPLVGCLCTLGCAAWEGARAPGQVGRRRELGALLLGCAVALRPELAGFAFVTALVLDHGRRLRQRFGPILLLLAPPLVVAGLRLSWFDTPLPLALLAKEPDLSAGLRYGIGSLVLCGPLWLIWGLAAERAASRPRWWLAFAAHGASVVLAGGDWMPLYRLWLPVLPWLVAVGVRDVRRPRLVLAIALGAACVSSSLLFAFGAATRQVVPRREHMVAELRPLLQGARRIATVDIGWVGRATGAEVIDLAGVTDPRVAALSGGHTSKRIAPGFFAARSIDTWLIRAADRSYVVGAPLQTVACTYVVDARLVQRALDLGFQGVATVAVPGTDEQYVVARLEGGRL